MNGVSGERRTLPVVPELQIDPPAGSDPATISAETAKQISDLQAVLVQAISEAKSGLSGDIAKIGTKLDAPLLFGWRAPHRPALAHTGCTPNRAATRHR